MNRRDVREEVRAVAIALGSPHETMWRFDNGYNQPPSHVRALGGSWLKPEDANWLGLVRLARQLLASRLNGAPAVREEKERPRV